jgi:putative endopeptidase
MRFPLPCRLLFAIALTPLGTLSAQGAAPIKAALDPANIDRKYGACEDFYMFANGGWIQKNPIPPAFASWGKFAELTESNGLVLRDILDNAARVAATTTDPGTRKLGTFYASCMDSTAAESAGISPLVPELNRIAAISDRTQLRATISRMHSLGLGGPFSFGAGPDQKNARMVIAHARQGGISLPDREYYLRDDPAARTIRTQFVESMTKMFSLVGDTREAAVANAQRVLSMETALARGSMTRVAMRDPNADYHPMTLAEAKALTPGFDWGEYLRVVGLPHVTSINVGMPDFFKVLDTELTNRPLDDWKAYLRWVLITRNASVLSSPFVKESFRFNSLLSGARELQPRWKRCLNSSDQTLGDALGREYVKVVFTPEAKAKMMAMVMNLRAVMRDRIARAEWMSETTRQEALRKMDSFNQKIGYPETWRDYAELDVTPGPFVRNVLASRAAEVRRDYARVGKPVDRKIWRMTAPTVNAYYSQALNEIVFPAGRLQPPFFALSYDDAANYGGVGGTIGHEISHGFDDSGRQYDADGNLRDWWTADDASRYRDRAAVVETQYNTYVAIDTLRVNGKLTLGENLADVVGVSVAFEALQRALQGKPRQVIDGFTPEQRFFLAYAQARLSVNRPELARVLVATGAHSPGPYRVNGPLSNMPEFAKAFGCKPGDSMVRPDSIRARIW